MNRQAYGICMLLLSALVIGVMPSSAKLAYSEGANPIALLVARSAIGVVGMIIYLRLRGESIAIPQSYLRPTALCGIAQFVSAGGLLGAIAYIDVSLASIIIFTHPLLIGVVNHVRGRSRLTVFDFCLIALAFLGLTIVLGVDFNTLDYTGIALGVAASLGITVMILSTTDTAEAVGAVRANLHMTIWATLYFIILAFLGPEMGLIDPLQVPESGKGWLYILIAGVSFTLGYLFFFVAATVIGATRAAMLSIIEPIMMILFAVALVGEWLTAFQWLGVALVLGSLWILETMSIRRAKQATIAA